MRTIKYFPIPVFAIIFSWIWIQPSYAQSLEGRALTDSLIQELQKTKDDTSQARLLLKISRAMLSTDPSETMRYADSALHFSQKHNWQKEVGLAYTNKALAYRATSNYAAGLESATRSYEILDSLKWKPGMGNALSEIANNYERLGNYTKAIENNFKAITIYEELGLDVNIALMYNNLGIDYYKLGDYSEAIENYKKALEIFRKTNNKYGIASALDNIATVYVDKGEPDKVNEYNLQAVKLFEEINDEPAMGRVYINRGSILTDQKHFDSAFIYYKKAIAIAQKLNIGSTLAYANGGIAEIYLKLAKNLSAQYNIPDSLKISKKMLSQKAYNYFSAALQLSEKASELSLMMKYTALLSETEALRGNYQAALNFYKQSAGYKDSIFNDDNKTKIAALEKERLAEVKDKEIQLLNKENALQATEAKRVKNIQYFTIAALAIVVLAVVIIALLQYRNNRHKQKANVLLQQQKEKVESTLTELKSTQAQLIQSEKMASLGELTAGIAHEIQNPLNFVNNFSEVNTELIAEMKNELLTGSKEEAISIANDIQENAQKIIHHGKRAESIVKGMLQHSRTSTGQKELTDINALADECLRLSYHGIRAKDKSFNAEMKTDFDNSIQKIHIVPQDMGRVFINIINNAFFALAKKEQQHEGFKPFIMVSTKKLNGMVEISIEDNGTGIPQNIVDKIFQPFFTTKPTGEGTGLGLSLSYDIIKTHGGEIKVETTEAGGAKFIIQIPF